MLNVRPIDFEKDSNQSTGLRPSERGVTGLDLLFEPGSTQQRRRQGRLLWGGGRKEKGGWG